MAYECQNFKNGQVLTAECLNRIDKALEEICKKEIASVDVNDEKELVFKFHDGTETKVKIEGVTCTHSWDGTVLTITSAGGTSSADLKGEQGTTPHIGYNGNWWIGETDTGVPASGGGAGGGGLEYTITLKNTLENRVLTVSEGQAAELKFTYTSVDSEGYDDGAGIGSVVIDGVKVHTFNAVQGDNIVDITNYLTPGEHTVNVRIENSESSSRSLTYTVTLLSLSMSTTFTELASYSGDVTFYYTPIGTGTKTIHFIMDGKELPSVEVTTSGRSCSYIIPAQSHGGHIFEAYAEMTISNVTVKSNVIKLGMMWIEANNVSSSVVSTFDVKNAKQGEALNISYLAYDPTSESAAITLSVLNPDGTVYSTKDLYVDRNPQSWIVNDYPVGSVTFSLSVRNATVNKSVEVAECGIDFELIKDSLVFNFDAAGRSNLEDNPAVWTDETTTATFENVAFAGADGWLTDTEGSPMLRLLPGSEMYLPFNLFATDHRDNGVTIEVEMATSNVRDYDSVVMSCLSGGRGFKIASQYAQLNSEQSEISMQFKEDQRVRVTFVVNPKNLMRLIFVFVNGVMCGAVQYPDNDNFAQSPATGITIGAESSGIDIYRIALYNKGLTRHEVLANYVVDRATLSERMNAYYRNDVLDVSENVNISKLPSTLPYMIVSSVELPQAKKNPKPCSITYVDPANRSNSFTAEGATIDVQGTSSAGYKKKNFLISLLEGLTYTATGTKSDKYALSGKSVPVNVFCLKADVASSDSANNVELVKLYNETCPYRHEAMKADSRVRYGIEGYPIVVFWHNTATGETTFWGKYNFNNDKSTPEVFGFSEGYECWEIKNNTSNRVLFKTSDYGSGWEDDFEAVYPSKHKDVTNLKTLTDWIASTNRYAVSTQAAKEARLNKFRNEFENYFVKDAMLFFYLFTETFLMVDSRAKNFFPTYDPNIRRWFPFPYDMDTALGINNEGKLVFDYDLEDTDKVGTADVYNAQESVLWNNVRDAFAAELAAMYVTLRNTSNADGEIPYGYDYVLKQFKEHQRKWPEAIWNEDAYEKYLRPLFDENDASYLTMLQGDKASQRDWWMFNGFRYRDSKYKAGDANTNFITLRCYALGDITVTPYSHIWSRIKYGSYTVTERAKRNVPVTLDNPNDNLNDTETYIYSADRIADIGDFSPLQVGYADFTAARKLQKLKLGDGAANYQNTNLTELYVGNNDLLIELDVQNCVNLTQSVDLSACDSLETVKAKGTAVTGFTLPVGGRVKTLELPGTIANFTIRDQKMLESVTFEGYNALTTIRVENTPNINVETLINSAPALNRVRLIGVEWVAESEATLEAAITKLKNCIGMDAAGTNTEKAVVSGRLYVDSISAELLGDIQDNFPEVTVVVDGVINHVIRYYNEDGTFLHREIVADGEDAIDPVELGRIPAPTKEKSENSEFVFASWDIMPTDVHKNYSLVAQYAATSWAVYYLDYNGGELYKYYAPVGSDAIDPVALKYIDTPVREGGEGYGYVFTSWGELPTNIQGVCNVTAQYAPAWMVCFYNEGELVEVQYVQDGLAAVDPVEAGRVTPTKVGEPQYEYTFSGWDKAFDNITAPLNVNAVFTETLRTFTVRFYNEDVLLQTVSGVPYGGTAIYTGDEPVKEGDWAFAGWSPEPTNVTADTDCYAQFKSTEAVSRKLVERTLAGEYVNDRVTSVGAYGLGKFANLTKIDLPSVNSIEGYAFEGCVKLTALILRNTSQIVTLVASYAFPSTPIASGGGYIYVPRALLSDDDAAKDYRRAKNWANYATKFRAIEDYPEICGGVE